MRGRGPRGFRSCNGLVELDRLVAQYAAPRGNWGAQPGIGKISRPGRSRFWLGRSRRSQAASSLLGHSRRVGELQ